jgi:hypothetical protein
MELLADKELLEDVKKLINIVEPNKSQEYSENTIQSGGYVFNLIPAMTAVFAAAVEFIGKFFVKSARVLFKFNIWKVSRDKDGNEFAYVSPHLKANEGQLWRYIRICVKASLFLCIFALGGVIVTVFGVLYLYTKLFKHFGKLNKKDDLSDEPNKKPEEN